MEIFRTPPYPLVVPFSNLSVSTDHLLSLYNSRTEFKVTVSATSSGSGDIAFSLPESIGDYDDEYRGLVHEGTTESDPVVASDNVRVIRPYLIPADIAPVVGDVPNYTRFERLARMQIDNIVGGFYHQKKVLDLQGMGNDKLTVGQRATKVLGVTCNNVVVYDSGLPDVDNEELYALSADHQNVIRLEAEGNNLAEGFELGRNGATFPKGWDFKVTIESGWPYVPQDIKDATLLLIEDMACMTPNYLNKYVREYETKDFRVDIHRPAFAGTGNLMVDQVLAKYLGDTLYDNVRVL